MMQQGEHKSEKFKCNECGMTFNSEREQREHQENAHRKGAGQGGRQGGSPSSHGSER